MKLKNYEVNVETTFTKQFHEGQILFGRRRAYQHKACVATFDGICSGDITVIEPIEGKVNPDLLPFIIQNDDFFEHAIKGSNGALSPRVKWEHMANFEFNLPSLAEQKVLAEKLWAAYEVKQSYLKMIAATEEMVKSQFIEMFGCSAERVALSSLCDTFIDGDWIEAKDQSDSGIRLIQTGNVGVGTFKDKGDKARYISEDTFNRLNCTEVVEGDILISRLPDPVGRACIVPAGLGKCITAVDCTIIKLNDKVLPKFFVAFTNTPDYAMQIKQVLSGTTRLRISRANLGKIQFPLPTRDKQQQFVTIAEQADKSISELRKSVDAIDKVIKSLINENL
jgi:type I restriction enzyme S subunit